MSLLMSAYGSMVAFQFFILQLLDFMPPVTCVVLVECTVNGFVPPQNGMANIPNMTLYSLRQIWSFQGCEVWQLDVFSCFFSFTFWDVHYPCALIHWHSTVGDEPDEDTRLWVVKPEFTPNGHRNLAIVHLESIARGAHLIGVYGSAFLPEGFHFSYSLDVFRAYFVNCYADHHTHKFLTSTTLI
jgi:hypothetical protein